MNSPSTSTTRSVVSRKRTIHTITTVLVVAAVAFLPASIQALSSVTTSRTRSASSPTTLLTDQALAQQRARSLAYTPAIDEDDEEDLLEEHVAGFQQLLQSTGSEILQSDLQQQIDLSSENPNVFLQQQNASYLEQVAMGSVPEQLPQAAVQALQEQQRQKQQRRSNKSDFDYASPRVTHEQEIALARMIQEGVKLHKIRSDAAEKKGRSLTRQEWAEAAGLTTKELRRRVSHYRQAKQQLVSANMGLVHAVVNQKWHQQYRQLGIPKEELVQEGSLGLIRAAELFDPERGLRFSTYATIWTKAALSNSHLSELVRLPAREKTKYNKIQAAHKDLEESGSTATVEELAAVTGLPISEVLATQRRMNQAQRVLSLDYEYDAQSRSGSETSSMTEALQHDKAFQHDADLAERTHMHADVVAAMARNLDAREARLMRLRYGLSDGRPRTIAECADAMGLSRTRVQQLAQRCLKKLRQAVEAESLEEYLLTIA